MTKHWLEEDGFLCLLLVPLLYVFFVCFYFFVHTLPLVVKHGHLLPVPRNCHSWDILPFDQVMDLVSLASWFLI